MGWSYQYLIGTVGMLAVTITYAEPWLLESGAALSEYRDG
jgi:hypothetical protein